MGVCECASVCVEYCGVKNCSYNFTPIRYFTVHKKKKKQGSDILRKVLILPLCIQTDSKSCEASNSRHLLGLFTLWDLILLIYSTFLNH